MYPEPLEQSRSGRAGDKPQLREPLVHSLPPTPVPLLLGVTGVCPQAAKGAKLFYLFIYSLRFMYLSSAIKQILI